MSLAQILMVPGLGSGPAVYLDSNAAGGGDGTAAAPYNTLADAVGDLAEGYTLKIARGSVFYEGWDGLADDIDNLTISAYGTGALPIFDGSDAVETWTLHSGNVYKADVAIYATGSAVGRCVAIEDGNLLKRVASVGAMTAGTYYTGSDTMQTSPLTVYIWPSDSGDPNSNGSEYRVTTRYQGVRTDATSGLRAFNLIARFFGANNGPFSFSNTLDVDVSNVISIGGGKHNIVIGGGTLRDSRFIDSDFPTVTEPANAVLTAYHGSERINATFRNIEVWNEAFETAGVLQSNAMPTLYAHAGTGDGKAGNIVVDNLKARWMASVLGALSDSLVATNIYGYKSFRFGSNSGGSTSVTNFQNHLTSAQNDTIAGTVSLENGMVMPDTATTVEIYRINSGNTLNLTNVLIHAGTDDGRIFILNNTGTANITASNCVFFGRPNFARHIDLLAGGTYSGDFNVFAARRITAGTGVDFSSKFNGTTYNSLASWQAATGEDANSVYLTFAQMANFFLNDPTTGDYRINPDAEVTGGDGTVYVGTFADGVTPITNAGPQDPLPTEWQMVTRGKSDLTI